MVFAVIGLVFFPCSIVVSESWWALKDDLLFAGWAGLVHVFHLWVVTFGAEAFDIGGAECWSVVCGLEE